MNRGEEEKVTTIQAVNMFKTCNFRTADMKYTILCPKFAQSQGKYGKLYASSVKVLVQQQAFSLPKGSPLQVSLVAAGDERTLCDQLLPL